MKGNPGSHKREIAPNNDRALRRKSILRWCIAILLSFAILGALSISYRFSGNTAQGISDELLAFEITPAHPTLVLTIPGGIPEIELTTWGSSPPLDELDPKRVFRYALSISFFSRTGEKVLERVFEPETKITIDPAAPAYRIFGESDWIADPRTVSIPLDKFLQEGGTAKVELRSSDLPGILLRPIHREPRSSYERIAFEKAFRTDTMQRLARGKQSLGFADLSTDQKELYLSRWGRRLDATGNERRDFFLRRLLLSDNIKKPRIAPSKPPEIVTEQQWIAINLLGAVRITFEADGPLEVVQHGNPDLPLPMQTLSTEDGAPSRGFIEDGNLLPHSLYLRAKKGSVAFHMHIASEARAHIIGPSKPLPPSPTLEIEPDTRRQPLIQLDPITPARFHISTGQELLRLEIRAVASRPLWEEEEDTVTLRWKLGEKEEVRPVRVRLMRSPFETLGDSKASPPPTPASTAPPIDRGIAATLAYPIQLRIPPGVTDVEVLGASNLLASASVVDPFQHEDILQPPYRVQLQEDEVWRFAPFDVHRWVPVWPDNFKEILAAKRDRKLLAQTRIEKKGAYFRSKGSGGLERPLAAVGKPYARHFFEPALLSPESALPQDGWTVFREEARVRVEGTGPRGGELLLRYATTSGMLGKELHWSLDKDVVRTTPVSLRSGEARLAASPGFHRIGVDAPKEDVVVWVNAAPAQEGTIVRERTVYETTAQQDVGFRIDRRGEKATTLALTIVTTEQKGAYALSYIIDGGRPLTKVGVPFHRATVPNGVLRGVSGLGGGAFVEGADDLFQQSLLQRGIAKTKIRLGDDLGKGLHEIRFRSLIAGKTWVRLTLIGEADDTFASESHAWLDDE